MNVFHDSPTYFEKSVRESKYSTIGIQRGLKQTTTGKPTSVRRVFPTVKHWLATQLETYSTLIKSISIGVLTLSLFCLLVGAGTWKSCIPVIPSGLMLLYYLTKPTTVGT